MVVGVLALQGDFANHQVALERFGIATRPVRCVEDLLGISGLVLPGGESGSMLRQMGISPMGDGVLDHERSERTGGKTTGLFEALKQAARSVPVLGTCAGLILLASDVLEPQQQSLGILDLTVHRNGYGRQIRSGTFELTSDHLPDGTRGVFIRAPRITRVGATVQVLATRDGDPVLVRQGDVLAACFHPELEPDHVVTRMFVAMLARIPA